MNKKEEAFLTIAKEISSLSTCLRAKVGAIIVKDDAIISTGFNTAPINQKNCTELGYCFRNKNNIQSGTLLEMCRSAGSHAESNAVASASLNGISTKNSTIYVYGNNYICNICKGIVMNAGITNIIHKKLNGEIIYDSVENNTSFIDNQVDIFKKIEELFKKFEFETIMKFLNDYLYGCSDYIKDIKEYMILSMLIKSKIDNSIKKMLKDLE